MRFTFCSLIFVSCPALLSAQAERPVRIAVAGLAHGHVEGFLLRPAQSRKDVQIVGVFEPDTALSAAIAKQYGLAQSLLYTDLGAMLDAVHPDAVATFTNTFEHAMVVETAASRHLPVMMEKPLAVSVEHARRIESAARRYGIPVIVNYETSWYPSHGAIWDLVKTRKAAGEIRRMVAMDGHEGPKEIAVGPNFLAFLGDPKLNGAGALFDFGCYGANLMTWLMDNRKPLSVTAVTRQMKPEIYPRVDDDATVLLEYPGAQGVIEASWNWPFSRKDFEVYGQKGYAIATGGSSLRVRLPGLKEEIRQPEPLSPDEHDPLSYFVAVVRGARKSTGLSSLENNLIVTEILEAARESAKTRKTIRLQ